MSAIDTLSPRARKGAEWALLNELAEVLEMAHDKILELRDANDTLNRWPVTSDARGLLQQITESVEVLDVFGWQKIIDHGNPKAEGGERR